MAVGRGSGMEVRITLNDLPRIRSRFPTAVQAILGKVTFDALGHAIVRAPVDTGALKNSLKAEVGLAAPGIFYGQVFTQIEYAPYVEFGTRYQNAQPFMTPAFEKVLPGLTGAFKALEGMLR